MSELTSKTPFAISECLRDGWNTFKANWPFVLGVSIVMFAIQFAGGMLTGWLEGQGQGDSGIVGLLNLVFTIINLIVGMGWIYILIKLIRNQTATINDLFAKTSVAIKYIAGVILYALIVFGGMLLLIIPGIYFAIKYAFAPYLIIDKGVGPIDALKMSAVMTKGVKWELLGFHLIVLVINVLGLLALGVGLLVTTPVTALAYVSLYDRLLPRV